MADRNAWSLGTRAKLAAVIVSMTILIALGLWQICERPTDTTGWSGIVVGTAGIAIYARSAGVLRRSRSLGAVVAVYATLGLLGSAGFWFMLIRYREFHRALLLVLTMVLSLCLVVDTPFVIRDAIRRRRDNKMSKDD